MGRDGKGLSLRGPQVQEVKAMLIRFGCWRIGMRTGRSVLVFAFNRIVVGY